jgi:cellulose synthase/poly-beta-1,6-N-acetylglucosamine synthase-like glycosyltransferase
VVARDVDKPTQMIAAEFIGRLPLDLVIVREPGQVRALNAGLVRANGDIVSITDDDAAPYSDWLKRIAAHFDSDPEVGGVGGRDWVHTQDGRVIDSKRRLVGRVQWFGRIVGNHHLGAGPAREVSILKGVNMSYRRCAIEHLRFDTRLRGRGAQVHNDMCFSMAVRRSGWRLIYDPAVGVDHYPAVRLDVDQRDTFNPEAVENAAFNLMWSTQKQLSGWKRLMVRRWQIWVGTRDAPGVLRAFQAWIKKDEKLAARFIAAHRGRIKYFRIEEKCRKRYRADS